MCGIIGMVGNQPAAQSLLEGLRRLEYRGYDSAGLATWTPDGIERRRAEGKLAQLDRLLARDPLPGTLGIGHTRWATHGRPNTANAHPHATREVAVVHNGIIENYRALRAQLSAQGVEFESDTDTEAIVHLVATYLRAGKPPLEAVQKILPQLQGAYALAFLFQSDPDLLIGVRHGAPLAIGTGDKASYLGSDALALAPFTRQVTYLDDGDFAVLRRSGFDIFNASGQAVQRSALTIDVKSGFAEKGPYAHFMLKEIHEQPEVVAHTLTHYIDMAEDVPTFTPREIDFSRLTRVALSACGTAYYAALTARYWFERYAALPVDIDMASEFRYREAPLDGGGLALFVSQSGETADTLATLRYCRAKNQKIASLVNVPYSTIARESDASFLTCAGPEIGVASTKAFTCQLAALACLAITAGQARGVLHEKHRHQLVEALIEAPRHMTEVLQRETEIQHLAQHLKGARSVLYLGRGTSFPLALEGALKLKEISYIHAEGYAAGELKHGPIALIDDSVPVVVIAPHDKLFPKTLSNVQEVAARGGRVMLLTDRKGAEEAGDVTACFIMPDMPSFITPLVYALPLQLLAYHTAVALGRDVDQPRNLAKSVTVE